MRRVGCPRYILVKNLPDPLRNYLNRKKQLAADINSFSDQVQADASAAARAQANLMALKVKEEQAELTKMKKQWAIWMLKLRPKQPSWPFLPASFSADLKFGTALECLEESSASGCQSASHWKPEIQT